MTTSVMQQQSTTTSSNTDKAAFTYGTGWQWLKEGFALLRKSPVKIILFAMLPMLLSGFIQLLPAPYSIITSKWFGAAAVALLWPLLHHIHLTGQFSFKSAFSSGNWLSVALFGLTGIAMAAMQFGVAMLVIGPDAVELLLHMKQTEVARWQLGLVFASAMPLMLLLSFAPARILLENQRVMKAISESIHFFTKAWKPLLIIGIGYALILFAAPYIILSVIIFGPLMSCALYAGYTHLTARSK